MIKGLKKEVVIRRLRVAAIGLGIEMFLVLAGVIPQASIIQLAEARTLPPIWLSPRSDGNALAQLAPMFSTNAPWQEIAPAINVFELSGGAIRRGSGDDVRSMANDLARRNIALSIGISPLSGGGKCGNNVEGYNAPNQPRADAAKLKQFGGTASFFTMDEPLYYGHRFTGKNACHSSIAEIARDVSAKIKEVRSIYPNARVGDIEPIGGGGPSWLADLANWLVAYRAATGEELAFFRADVQWNSSWKGETRALADLLKSRGIQFQIIYNGNAHSDAQWVDQATSRFEDFEELPGFLGHVAVFQCWTPNPVGTLPETDPKTLSGLVLQYIRWNRSEGRKLD